MPDRVISHYRIIEKIGAGAMGEVFRARDERLGRDVAIKLIRPASSANPDHLRRFELEARAAAALSHPNIVAIYDVGLSQGSPYIVCELLEGKTLRQRLDEGPLPLRVALNYAQQIVQGLIAAHDRRIVHRDLKPDNLFVTTDGRVKILDFGVAKLQAEPEESGRSAEQLTTVTRSGALVGTYAYMSPEQLRTKPVDHRSDIFSMGAILYEVFTGRRAFRGETQVDTITAVLKEEPPEINLEQAQVPVSCRQIVQHCLEKDPENRFQSARDLAFALATLAETSGRTLPRRKFSRPVGMIPWALAALLLVTSVFLLIKPPFTPNTSPNYRRLTYEQGTVYSARFAPGFRDVVYAAAWNGRPIQLFSTVGDSLLSQPLDLTDAKLLAISHSGELAVTMHGLHMAHLQIEGGMLARAPVAGGSPREVLEDVSWADWSANDELAVVHHAQGHDQIEYPIGHVLYQSQGWISHLRFAPQDGQIAFIDHPVVWDDSGSICGMDGAGHVRVLSTGWESAAGLAWAPGGKEIWFTAVEKGERRQLLAVNMSGKTRKVLELPEGMTVQDIAPGGRVLLSVDTERLAMATTNGDGTTVDISWHDWSVAKDISADGRLVLFEDASEVAGPHYALAIRNIDGTPPVELGEGSAGKFSPDGKWAISVFAGSPGEIRIVPIGPGQPRTIGIPGLNLQNGSANFLADGKHITVNATEPGHSVRTYLVNLDDAKAEPVTPDGITGGLISPDGRYFVRINSDHVVAIYPIGNNGAAHVVPNLESNFAPIQWSEDSSSIYDYLRGEVPSKLFRVNLASGQKTVLHQLQPEKMGAISIGPVVVTRDGSRYAYSYHKVFSVLYVISGLR